MYLPDFMNLGVGFKKYFEAVAATTPALREEVFRIRHEVYCRELGFEPLRDDGMETDDFDRHALHCLLRRTDGGPAVGCIRLILADPDNPAAPLPFETTCTASLNRDIVDPAALPRDTIAEVSRLAVLSRYRRRKGETGQPFAIADSDFSGPAQPRFPYIPVGLYLGMITLAQHHGIETLFVLTEPALVRSLSPLGVKVRQIGGAVQHRGTRVPSTMSVAGIVKGLNPLLRPLYDVIRHEIEAGLRQADAPALSPAP